MKILPLSAWLITVILFPLALQAELRVAQIFGDNMVLQRDQLVPVWGWAEPGESVAVTAAGMKAQTKADASGKWMAKIGPFKVGEPFSLTVKGSSTITFNNVVAGEVWICSGQSNMEWSVNGSRDALTERSQANYPMIRHVKVRNTTSGTPLDDTGNSGWQVCTPEAVGAFTAVGYFFGRHLQKELHVPIGLLNTSWGGTIVETWASAESVKTHPDFTEKIAEMQEAAKQTDTAVAMNAYNEKMEAWQIAYEKALQSDDEQWQVPVLNVATWKTMKLPGLWEGQGLPNFDGLVWFRKTVDVPASWAGKECTLSMSPIDDMDTTWVNGVRVGGTENYSVARKYTVPGSAVKAGQLSIAVRVHDTGGGGGFHGDANLMKLECAGEAPISIAGEWAYALSSAMARVPVKPTPPASMGGPNHPTLLYNAMVHPIVPYAVKGAIWYQGESNAGRAYQYRSLFPLMINDWRKHWSPELSFYFVQLANFMAPTDAPQESAWAELREAQSMTLSLPKTGQAVIIDIGEAADIHPKNKQDVGLRLAYHALAKDYGKKVVYSGPTYQSMKKDGAKIRLAFDHLGGGLKAVDGQPLKHFAIAGADQKFVWADAVIDGGEVIVSSPQVAEPVAVRYAWANNPEGCNLYNAAGLPASPFRTDDWPGVTVNSR
ncbi:MAG: sialate O-acetylesterase [Kiritimatiellia bacterium]|jgi:sialate O-acetylesterase